MYQVEIYVKQGCPKCRLTMKRMSTYVKVNQHMVDPDNDLSIMKQFIDKGYQSFPVVKVTKDNKKVDEWCDFRVDKIKEWGNKLQ